MSKISLNTIRLPAVEHAWCEPLPTWSKEVSVFP